MAQLALVGSMWCEFPFCNHCHVQSTEEGGRKCKEAGYGKREVQYSVGCRAGEEVGGLLLFQIILEVAYLFHFHLLLHL